jgi:hypothetical protein
VSSESERPDAVARTGMIDGPGLILRYRRAESDCLPCLGVELVPTPELR